MHIAIRQLAPNLAYLIPDQHNPTGLTMPVAQRKQLAHIIYETRTRTIIDETMTDIWLDEPVPAPAAAAMTRRPDLMLTVGSMSKSFWAGLRIGWIRAERATLATIAVRRPSVDLGTAILEQLAAARLLAVADDVLPERRELIRHRRAPAEIAAHRTAARLAAMQCRPADRRPGGVDATAGADELSAVGRGVAARGGNSTGTTVRGGRHPGALHPGALQPARRSTGRRGFTSGAGVGADHRPTATAAPPTPARRWSSLPAESRRGAPRRPPRRRPRSRRG